MRMTSPKWEGKEEKKLLKPLMEKRRRDRMNQSLDRLRVLLFEATQDERLKNPKVEKAEILQKTVQFLKTQPLSGFLKCHLKWFALWETKHKEDALLQRYHRGYWECLTQAAHFLRASPGSHTGKKAHLMEHLCHRMGKITTNPCGPLRQRPPPAAASPSYDLPQPCSPEALAGCSPPLGGAAYVLHPPAPRSGLPAHVTGPAQPGGCSRPQQNKLSGTQNSVAQTPQALNVWRPWP